MKKLRCRDEGEVKFHKKIAKVFDMNFFAGIRRMRNISGGG